jgi:hypothetical protein
MDGEVAFLAGPRFADAFLCGVLDGPDEVGHLVAEEPDLLDGGAGLDGVGGGRGHPWRWSSPSLVSDWHELVGFEPGEDMVD